MSQTIGKCGRCGYRQEAAAQAKPSRTTPTTSKEIISPITFEEPSVPAKSVVLGFEAARASITEQIAQAYSQVARAEGDMREGTSVLEQARVALLTERDALKIWKLLDESIGPADPATLRPSLIHLRAWFEAQLCDQQERRLRNMFDSNEDKGWREWQRTFAEALAYWRLTLCRYLINAQLPFPKEFTTPHDFKTVLRLILHDRWPEIHHFLPYLAQREFLQPITRARLLIAAGQINLYYFPQSDGALALFKEAETQAPGTPRVAAALGDYYIQQGDFQTARVYLDQALASAPDEVEAYIYMGDLEDRQGKLEQAATWYQEAINKVAGDALGYTRLLRLYGRPEFIERYESYIIPLAERAAVIDEIARYRTYLDVGDAYLASKRYDAAQEKYQQAVDLDPERLDGYVFKGFAYIEEGARKFQSAQQAFAKSREVAPEAYNGYWGAGQLCERQQQWAEAADWYAQVSERQPELQTNMLGRIAQMRRTLNQYDEAETALLEALRIDRSSEGALFELIDEYKQKESKSEDVLKLFKRIRDITGDDSFEAAYENRQGNSYFNQQQWDQAAEHYLNAIRLDDKQAIYYANLAGAYSPLQRWTEVREQLKKAYELDGDQHQYRTKSALVYNDEGNLLFAQGQFELAESCYAEADRLDPLLPRFASNRSLALEQIAQQVALAMLSGEQVESRPQPMETLAHAVANARAALESAQSKEEWASELSDLSAQVDRIERKHRMTACYGPAVLTVSLRDSPVRAFVTTDVAELILNAERTDLSDEFVKKIGAFRERIQKKHGLLVAQVSFAPLEAPEPLANYRVEVLNEPPEHGKLETDRNDPQEELLHIIELAVIPHLEKLCGYQEAADLLARCDTPECGKIKSPYQLHQLTLRLKELLRGGESIADCARICEELNRSLSSLDPASLQANPQPPVTDLDPGITSLTLNISRTSSINRAQISATLTALPNLMLALFGVPVPQGTIVESDALDQNDFQLQLGEKKFPPRSGLSDDEVLLRMPVEDLIGRFPNARSFDAVGGRGTVLKRSEEVQREIETSGCEAFGQLDYLSLCLGLEIGQSLDVFLTSDIVEYYLSVLNSESPTLIAVTRFFFSTERLTECLRETLRAKSSIKNLPQQLETLLNRMEGRTAAV
jgi:tetratricopeptide (TPR) repeat protein